MAGAGFIFSRGSADCARDCCAHSRQQNGLDCERRRVDDSTRHQLKPDDRPTGISGSGARAALVVREGIVFTEMYAKHLAQTYGLRVFTALNETEARRRLDGHPEIAFMLIDNRLPDRQGVERDGIGMALADEYRIPTILVTGGPAFSQTNPLVTCLFAINWPILVAATRRMMALVQKQVPSRADEALLAGESVSIRRASVGLYREVTREQPAPPGLHPYEPIDERYVRDLRNG
jgi:hypothetical protein